MSRRPPPFKPQLEAIDSFAEDAVSTKPCCFRSCRSKNTSVEKLLDNTFKEERRCWYHEPSPNLRNIVTAVGAETKDMREPPDIRMMSVTTTCRVRVNRLSCYVSHIRPKYEQRRRTPWAVLSRGRKVTELAPSAMITRQKKSQSNIGGDVWKMLEIFSRLNCVGLSP